jgi:hypothetical protein
MHFYHRDIADDTFAASHDSFDETSQHIFGVVLGGGVVPNITYEEAIPVIDLLPGIIQSEFGLTLNLQRQVNWRLRE